MDALREYIYIYHEYGDHVALAKTQSMVYLCTVLLYTYKILSFFSNNAERVAFVQIAIIFHVY